MKNSKISTHTLTTAAMLIAMGVVLSMIRIPLTPVTELTLTGLPIAAGGYLLGPWIGMLIGALIDICGFLAAPKGPFFPGFTISTALMGMIYGLFLYWKRWETDAGRHKAKGEQDLAAGRNWQQGSRETDAGRHGVLRDGARGLAIRVAAAHFCKTAFISLLLNCLWLSLFYGMDFRAVFLASIPKEAINFSAEVCLIFFLIRILKRISPAGGRSGHA